MKHSRRYQLKRRPRAYPITEQQEEFLNALQFCGVKKGMKKSDLQEKMGTCIPKYFKALKELVHVGENEKENNPL